jgi:hypothetical protein
MARLIFGGAAVITEIRRDALSAARLYRETV